jgi:hypothetical protein
MEFLQERTRFLYMYRHHLDFVRLTANRSVSDKLIRDTPDLPWNLDADGQRLPVPPGHCAKQQQTHTAKDQDEWNYIESAMSPYWTWDKWADTLDTHMADPRWPDRCGRWFFHNWSGNPALMRTSHAKVLHSLRRYLAATRIQHTLRRCISTPDHPLCRSRLAREFASLVSTSCL